MRTRRRINSRSSRIIGTMWKRQPATTGVWTKVQDYNNGAQIVGSSGWPYYSMETCMDEVHKGPPYLEGGPFYKWDTSSSFPDEVGTGTYQAPPWAGMDLKYVGGFCCAVVPGYNWFTLAGQGNNVLSAPINRDLVNDTWGSISQYSAGAWKKFQPGASIADASVFIGEISDVPRMLKTTASWFSREYISRFGRNPRGYAKVAADNWLNIQFGWLPFISDLRKFYRAWKVMDKWYQNLVDHNNQWVKRKGTVTKDESETVLYTISDGTYSYPPLCNDVAFNPNYATRGSGRIIRIAEQKVWFEGSFRYYVPEIRSVEWKRKAIAHLFGLDLNPAVVWELIPWSWLVDWFTNVGDLINNRSTGLFANLAAKYAYLMGYRDERVEVHSRPIFLGRTHQHSWTLRLKRKTRKEASPFGFDLSDSQLSARQWSILGALGISRLH